MTGKSGALFLNNSACTSARPQTHEPGWKRQDDGLNTQGGTGAERGGRGK